MKTAGLDAILSALTGGSAPMNTDKGATAEGSAFNAAFDAAASKADSTAPEEGAANSPSVAIQSSESGKVLPSNGKELPSFADNNCAEESTSESLAADSPTSSTLTPSPFMRAALDKAAAGAPSNYDIGAAATMPSLGADSAKIQTASPPPSVLLPAKEVSFANSNPTDWNVPGGQANSIVSQANTGTQISNAAALNAQEGKAQSKGEPFESVLETTAMRDESSREGRSVNSQGRAATPDAAINSLVGPNPTVRPAESAITSGVNNLLDIKAAPDAADFPQEVVARVRMIQGQGQTEARLNLHPAELGRLQIAITSDGDATRVAFVVDNAQAKEALEQAMPRLREFLQQAGLQLEEGSVSQQGHQDSAEFAQNDSSADDAQSANGNSVEENDVLLSTPGLSSDPDRILDAYA